MSALREMLQDREQYYLDMPEALPVAISTTDAADKMTYHNQTSVDFAGRCPKLGSDEWCGYLAAVLAGRDAHAECPFGVCSL